MPLSFWRLTDFCKLCPFAWFMHQNNYSLRPVYWPKLFTERYMNAVKYFTITIHGRKGDVIRLTTQTHFTLNILCIRINSPIYLSMKFFLAGMKIREKGKGGAGAAQRYYLWSHKSLYMLIDELIYVC